MSVLAGVRPVGGPTDVAAPVTLALFFVLLAGDRVLVRTRTPRHRVADRRTYEMIVGAVAVGTAIALAAPRHLEELNLPEWLWVPGALVMVVGIALRFWAIRTLGRSFVRAVTVTTDQPVVDHGPYRHLCHPSYTGLLLFCAGLGLAQANVVSILALSLLPGWACVRRIRVEELALHATLGDRYGEFARTRRRLIPGIW